MASSVIVSTAGETVTTAYTIAPTVAPSPGLFFKLPDDIRSHERKLFAHYFPTFPISVDNADNPDADYYARNYLKAAGESGAHSAMGGYIRNRPKTRPKIASNYVQADAATDISQAIGGGVDGFLCDVMSTGSKSWDFYMAVVSVAASKYPGFYVMPMVDVGGSIGNYSADQIADAIYAFAGKKSTYYLADGRMLVSSFRAEAKPLSWWQAIFTSLDSRYKVKAAFLPAYLNIGAAPTYSGQPWTFGSGFWGDGADPQIQTRATNYGNAVHSRGEKYMFPVQGQNIRNYSLKFDEALGTAALRAAWGRAISDQADFVQLVTWNDYSEGGEFNDSVAGGLTQLDISAYYSVLWKTGKAPDILTDAIYLAHRNQLSTARPTGGQTSRATQWSRGNMSPVADIVEVLTLLTDQATINVTIGGNLQTYTAPAGMSVKTFPLTVGPAPLVEAVRNGSRVAFVTSPAAVLSAPVKDDVQYFRASSIWGIAGQFDPQVKYGY